MPDRKDDHHMEESMKDSQPRFISRRKLLTALGASGAALVAGGVYRNSVLSDAMVSDTVQTDVYQSGKANPGNPRNADFTVTTISGIRGERHPVPDRIYFVTDPGQEGPFACDLTDTVSPDNTGTVIVSESGTRFKRIYDGPVNVRWFGAKGDGTSDDTAAFQAALKVGAGRRVYIPKGVYLISSTLIIPPGTSVFGDGNSDAWGETDGIGTVLKNTGAGTPARWTDIDGNDRTDFKPFLVFGGNEISLSRLSLVCDSSNRWDAAIFVPCVKRCSIDSVDTSGPWREAGLYLDATWSSTNMTLRQLHPEIVPSTGMNEFSATHCYLRGLWGVKVQGTTRNPDDYPDSFVWGWGGTSDLSFVDCRFGSDGPSAERKTDGGCYKHDAAIANSAKAGQGHNFVNCSFRTGSKYMIYLDRSNRDMFVNCYGETISSWTSAGNPPARFEVTSRTGYVSKINDHINAPLYVDDQLYSSGAGTTEWNPRAKVATQRYDGRMLMPNFVGIPAANQPVKLRSYYTTDTLNGVIHFRYVDSSGSDTIFADIAKERFNMKSECG
jgi:hypothetical protein